MAGSRPNGAAGASSAGPTDGVPRGGIGEQPGPQRRPPYGRNPLLAAHGVRARAEIVEAARDLFARCGYQATTVESIGEATGRSGAAVYQYFSGKFEIFAIFLQEVGVELIQVAEQFPLLTDDEPGRLELRDWIVQLMEVVERHAGTFLGWSQIQYSDPELGTMGQANFQGYQSAVAGRIAQAGGHPPNPAVMPVGILSVVQWSTLLNARRTEPVERPALAAAVAVMLHAYFFDPSSGTDHGGVTQRGADALPSIPLGDELGLRRPVTPRGAGTVQRILQAAAERFRINGFRGTSLNDVAGRAGVSHGSVYTYWADREALFGTLARDAVAAVERQHHLLPARPATAAAIDGWVEGWVAMIDTHGSVLYVWQHEVDAASLDHLTARRNRALDATVAGLLTLTTDRPDDAESLRVALRAVLTDVPYVLTTQLAILPRSASSGFVAGLLRAGLGIAPAAP